MRTRLASLSILTTFVVATTAARRAEACGGGEDGDQLDTALVLYSATTAGMLVKDYADDSPSAVYGVTEGFIQSGCAIFFGAAVLEDGSSMTSGELALALGITALHTTLAVHGWVSAYRAGKRPERADEPSQRPPGLASPQDSTRRLPSAAPGLELSLTPTAVTDGLAITPGLGVVGTF